MEVQAVLLRIDLGSWMRVLPEPLRVDVDAARQKQPINPVEVSR
jgi:hypothetical protein